MERRNAWLSYKEAEETEMEKLAKAYREFLDKGKTERECVAEIVKEAEAAGYESLESKLEKGEKIKAGDKVYAVGMKKIVALFHVGTEELSGGMSILCVSILRDWMSSRILCTRIRIWLIWIPIIMVV